MDINGFSRDPLNMADSNPGRVEYCPGGVGRNIAENLHRLGTEVRFIGVIGNDPGGELIRTSSIRIGLNIEDSLFLESAGQATSVYIALMDSNGEMKLALADMEILDRMTTEHLKRKAAIIRESAIVVLDANLSEEMICFIMDEFASSVSPGAGPLFFLDAVSARKAPRAASRIGSFNTLKLGRVEASALSGIALPSDLSSEISIEEPTMREKLKEVAARFIGKGSRRVFITLGTKGVFAAREGKDFFAPVRYVPPVNTSGGGDAFMAGIVYGTLQQWDEEETVSFSLACARITVQSKLTVSPDMSLRLVEKNIEEEAHVRTPGRKGREEN